VTWPATETAAVTALGGRYEVRRDERLCAPGRPWAVIDTRTQRVVACLVNRAEAEQAMAARNTKEVAMTSTVEAFPGDRTADEVRALLTTAVRSQLAAESDYSCWLVDWSDEWVAYERYEPVVGYTVWKAPYSMADDGTVTFGEPAKVERRTVYEPMAESVDRLAGRVLAARGTTGDGARVFEMRIVAVGDSLNGRRYGEAVLTAAAPLYEGAKVFDHHRTVEEMATGTVAGLVGYVRNVSATSEGLFGDLHVLPSQARIAEMLDAAVANQADGLPPLVGMSHDVLTRARKVVEGKRQFIEVTEIVAVNSADVVADPAAGGQAVRTVAGGPGATPSEEETMSTLLEQLKAATPEERAQLREALLADGAANPNPNPTPTRTVEAAPAERAAEATFATASPLGVLLVDSAVKASGLDARLAESVRLQLGDTFTEADLSARIDLAKKMAEAFEAAGLAPKVPHLQVTQEALDGKRKRLDLMLAGGPTAMRDGAYRSLKEAYRDLAGGRLDPLDSEAVARAILREAAGFRSLDTDGRVTESIDTSSFGELLGDSITRRMIALYGAPDLSTWRRVVSEIVPVGDFRTQRRGRMGGYGTLPTVNQGAPYQSLTSPADEEATYAATKRGGTEDLTLEAVTNDDLGAVRAIPRLLADAAAQTIYRFVWGMLANNDTCTYDSVALFHASHSNTTSSAALTQATLSAGRVAMRSQAAYGDTSRVLGPTPRILVVPNELEEIGYQLTRSAVAIPATAAGPTDTPNIHQGLELIVVDYWTDANDWFLVADASRVPTIEVGFLGGKEDPELFIDANTATGSVFTSDKVTYKIRHIYGGTILDHRGFYRGQG